MYKYLVLLLFVSVCLFSCQKDKECPKEPTDASKSLLLQDLQIKDDTILLIWTRPDTSVISYQILRREDSTEAFTAIANTFNSQTNTFSDQGIPYTPYIEYQIVAILTNGSLYSNTKVYERQDIKLVDIDPFDVLCDKQKKWLYFFETNGRISIYDYNADKIIKQISTGATIGFPDLGVHNSVKELYVPRNDGWVFIYNAATLDKLDQVSTGTGASSVVYNNKLLFVSTQAWTNYPLRVFERDTKNLVEKTGDFELTRLKKFPGTSTDIIEITQYIGPTDQDFYSFTPQGKLIAHNNDYYHGDYPLDANIFEVFPDGSKYITSSSGDIFDKNMTFKNTLPRGNDLFTCFEFDAANNLIYGGIDSKSIKTYSMSNYTYQHTIATKAYPFKVFVDGGSVICVSKTLKPDFYYPSSSKVIIEHL